MRYLPVACAVGSVRFALAMGFVAIGCGSSNDSMFGSSGANATSGGTSPTFTSGATGDASADGASSVVVPPLMSTEHGGYALGAPLQGDGAAAPPVSPTSSTGGAPTCSVLVGVVRDFRGANLPGGHPDFESFKGDGVTPGLVAPALGTDRKPVYTSMCEASLSGGSAACPFGPMTTSKADFDQWYRFTSGVNKPYILYLGFAPNGGVFTFQSDHYFPLDGAGWNDSATGDDGKPHNFSFTTEIHAAFQYNGGESFVFTGDDDVWVFMNGKLAVDLGGLHEPRNGTIDVDKAAASLGLVKGNTYAFELFQAERHTTGSNFRVDTNLAFTNCGTLPPDAPK